MIQTTRGLVRRQAYSLCPGRLPTRRIACLIAYTCSLCSVPFCENGHVFGYMLETLHWLPIGQRLEYRVAAWYGDCHMGLTPIYLCCSISDIPGPREKRSSLDSLPSYRNYRPMESSSFYGKTIALESSSFTASFTS